MHKRVNTMNAALLPRKPALTIPSDNTLLLAALFEPNSPYTLSFSELHVTSFDGVAALRTT